MKAGTIILNDTTTGIEYWKSNRKILAASKSLYTKLNEGAPRKSKCCCLANNKLDKILDTVETIKDKNDVVDKVCSLFECVICREVMKKPQFSPCCN